eukprot:6265349-Amphidinium_carterae.1
MNIGKKRQTKGRCPSNRLRTHQDQSSGESDACNTMCSRLRFVLYMQNVGSLVHPQRTFTLRSYPLKLDCVMVWHQTGRYAGAVPAKIIGLAASQSGEIELTDSPSDCYPALSMLRLSLPETCQR